MPNSSPSNLTSTVSPVNTPDSTEVFASSRGGSRALIVLLVLFDLVFVVIVIFGLARTPANYGAVVVAAVLSIGMTAICVHLIRRSKRRIEVTPEAVRFIQGDQELWSLPRSRVKTVRVWFHALRAGHVAKGVFVWDTDNQPSYLAMILRKADADRLVQDSGLPSSAIMDEERRWIIRHPVHEGGTGGVGMTRVDKLVSPLIRPGWYPAEPPAGVEPPH
jgi:hypothetical protein